MSNLTKLQVLGIACAEALELITQMEEVDAILMDAIGGEGPICGDVLECLTTPDKRHAALITLRSTAARLQFIANRIAKN